MKSQAITGFGKPLEEVELPTPSPTGTEILLKVTDCGVCHSDVHIHDGYFDMGGGNKLDVTQGRTLPITMGHEIAGEVVALGPNAEGVSVGQNYVVYPWIGCGKCGTCERGDEQLCGAPQALGVNEPGGYGDHVLVPHARYLIDHAPLPASLAAPYMCSGLTAFGALKKIGDPGPNERVAIVGLGGVGMMGLQFAKNLFPSPPLAADIEESKLNAAQEAGAGAVYNSADPESIAKVMADTDGGVYAAVDFVGSEGSLAFASGIVRRGGKVIIVGLFGGGFSMPIPLFPMRAISISGSFVGSLAETHEMMALVREGKIDPIPTATRPANAASQTLDDLREGNVVGRVVLTH